MADIGNQLEGVGDGLDRFLDALDSAAVKLGSTAALEAKISREEIKRTSQEARFKTKLQKMEKEHLKHLTETNKALKSLAGSLKKGIGKAVGALGNLAKAGLIGGLVVGVKLMLDGMLKIDTAMAGISKRTGMTRKELSGVRKEMLAAAESASLLGPSFEEVAAEAGNLVESLGQANMVSRTLIKDSLALQKAYGLSAQAAGQLTEALERTNRSGEEFRDSIREIAGKTGASAALVMRDMGARAQLIAIQNERSSEAMARMSAAAVAAGSSLSNINIKDAFGDIDNIASGLGDAAAIMGQGFVEAMGNAEELYELNLRGATGQEIIQARIMKAMKATVTLNKETGVLYHKSGRPLAEMEGYMERVAKFTGMTNADLQLMYRNSLKNSLEAGKQLSDAEHLQQVYASGMNSLEQFQKIITATFGKITTGLSQALGLDQEGGVKTMLADLDAYITKMFRFEDLAKDTAEKGGGFSGFVTVMIERLQPLWDDITVRLIGAFEKAMKWFGENYDVNVLGGIFGTSDFITRKDHAATANKNLQNKALLNKMMGNPTETSSKSLIAAPTATLGALGRIGGGLSIVGEAGGEVVASRSALRSGIGIGGRAASALAGIGVPGYREGYATADVSGITGRQGLMGAQGSQAFRASRGKAFQEEQARQQAAMMEYWRRTYENKMDDMIDEKAKKQPEPPWLAKFFKKYNKEIGVALNASLGKKAFGKEMTSAIMTGMTKWSQGGSLKEAMTAGAKAGIMAGLNDKDSSLYKLLESQGAMGDIAKAGLTAFAQGKSVKRAAVGAGARSLASYIQGGGNFGLGRKNKEKEMYGSSYSGAAEDLFSDADFAAKGKYVNSPTLMMVGETGQGEVVIPTERIRKGMPINAGVARELGSIGVPGFFGGGIAAHRAAGNVVPPVAPPVTGGGGYGAGVSGRFSEMGGFGGMARAGGAGALMNFASIYEQTGDWKQAATGGLGAGLGVGVGMGLTAMGIPPPLSGMIGNVAGGLITKGLNSVLKLTGGYGKGRNRALKLIENQIKTGGRFDFGTPSGLSKALGQGVGGYEKTPTQANFDKMTEKLGTSRLIASMGVPAAALIALGQGKMGGNQASQMYSTINRSLYGNTPDRYRKALAIPSLAAGGIVTRPTTALIGERGPEAVIPLGDSEMVKELKKQNKLMIEMIKTQKETAQTEIRLDGRVISETVGQNFYDIGNGL